MNAREGVRLALLQIRTQKLKSFFSVVGVIIGVMFLITVAQRGRGHEPLHRARLRQCRVRHQHATLARTPEFDVSANKDDRRDYQRRPPLRFADADAVRQNLSVSGTGGRIQPVGGHLVSETGTEVENVQLIAASPEMFRIRNYNLVAGRPFSPSEDRAGAPVIVLGWETRRQTCSPPRSVGRMVKVDSTRRSPSWACWRRGARCSACHSTIMRWRPRTRLMARSSIRTASWRHHGAREPRAGHGPRLLDIESTMRVRHRLRRRA